MLYENGEVASTVPFQRYQYNFSIESSSGTEQSLLGIAVAEKLNALRKAEAVQTKRDQWKAASAQYYERHPEVKEKKRVKAAEQRAAKKLARRRWDPPKRAPRARVELSHPMSPAALARIREGSSDAQLPDFSEVHDINSSDHTGTSSGYMAATPYLYTLSVTDGLFTSPLDGHANTLFDSGGDASRSHCPGPDLSVDAMAAELLLDLRAQLRGTSGVLF
ncbi:hypothetical protein K438DRAFT_1749546 [Mycena galopus ATCC 62051]|nr:hypothetical protein K438DRAFT_1749546 [Mycena galopus ATCC 62051]